MLGDEHLVAVLGRKLRAGVEPHAERGDVRPQVLRGRDELAACVLRTELGIACRPAVAVRIAEVLAADRDPVQFVGRLVVAQHVAAVVGEPQFVRARMPVEADGVAHAPRDDLEGAAVGIHPPDVGVALRIGLADVARRADRHVELAVGAERNELAPVMAVARESIADEHR